MSKYQQFLIVIILKAMFSFYSRLLDRYPFLTKSITAGLLFSFADTITQKCIEKKEKFDYRRNLNLALTSLTFSAPAFHVWLTHVLPRIMFRVVGNNTRSFRNSFIAMLLHQGLFVAPFCYCFFIYESFIKTFDREGYEKGVKAANQKTFESLYASWKMWPLVNMINFTYIPIKFQVLFGNFWGVIWNIYLSYITYR